MAGERSWWQDLKSDFPRRCGKRCGEGALPLHLQPSPKVAIELGAYNVLGKILSVYSGVARTLRADHDYDGSVHPAALCRARLGRILRPIWQNENYAGWLGR